MKLVKLISLSVLLAVLSACASTHPGKKGSLLGAEEDPKPIIFSAAKESDYSDENYTFIAFTLENKGKTILNVKSMEVDFDSDLAESANIVVGQDLVSWAEAWEVRAKQREHNQRVAQAALMLGGALVGITGSATNNKTLAWLGSGAMVGGAGWSLATTMNKAVTDAKNPQKVPETHIYSPFSVPANMFLRRWVLVGKPADKEIKHVIVKITFQDDSESSYAVAF